MMTDKIKFALQFIPLPIIYILYFPVYSALARININTAEWYSSGVIMLIGVVVGVLFYSKRISIVPTVLISISLIACGSLSTYQYSLFLTDKLGAFAEFWEAYKWLTTLPWHQTIPLYLGPILVGALCLKLIATHSGASNWLPRLRKKERCTSTKFGSAEFMPYQEAKKLHHQHGMPLGFPVKMKGSGIEQMLRCIQKTKETENNLLKVNTGNTVLIAPSRAGKGAGYIIPSLLDYQGPVFVCDPNHGENYAVTKRRREEMGRNVVLLDPFSVYPGEGRGINVLDLIISDPEEAEEMAAEMAELLCPTNHKDKMSHFDEIGASLIQCIILHVCFSRHIDKNDRTLNTVYHLVCATKDELFGTDDKKNSKGDDESMDAVTGSADETYAEGGEAPPSAILDLIIEESVLDGSAERIAKKILGTDFKEASGYLSTAFRELKFLDVARVKKHMSVSDFDMRDILKGDTDVFVVLPGNKMKRQSRYMRLMIGMALNCIMNAGPGRFKGEHNIKMVLDEFSALGFMQSVVDILTLASKYRVNVFAIVQTIEFLKASYPEHYNTFLSSNLSIFLATEDLQSSKDVSEKLGKKTIAVSSENSGIGSSKKSLSLLKNSSSDQEGVSISETSRALLLPEEVRLLGRDAALVFMAGKKPLVVKRMNYYEFKPWSDRYDNNPFFS